MTTPAFAPPDFLSKLCARQDAVARVNALKQMGPVVFTNGVFDVLHRGHATYLAHARALGASLVVAAVCAWVFLAGASGTMGMGWRVV